MDSYKEIGELVEKLRRRMRADEKKADFRVLDRWEEVVGKRIGEQTRPVFIVEGVLYVEATGSSWIQEMNYTKKEIIKKLNELFGREKVVDIKPHITEQNNKE